MVVVLSETQRFFSVGGCSASRQLAQSHGHVLWYSLALPIGSTIIHTVCTSFRFNSFYFLYLVVFLLGSYFWDPRFGGGFLWCVLFFCGCIVSESVVCRFGLGTVGEIRVKIVYGVNSIQTRMTVIAGQKFPTSFPGFSPYLFSSKLKIWSFHVVVVQRQQRNVQKSVIHMQSYCFAH